MREPKSFYNATYARDGIKDPKCFSHFFLFKAFTAYIAEVSPAAVVELGCGSGVIAHMLKEELQFKGIYLGYDFSDVAIAQAIKRMRGVPDFRFICMDLETGPFIALKNSIYLGCAFLEHVENDLEIISSIPAGSHVAFSVAISTKPKGHVRGFPTGDKVIERYFDLVAINSLTCIKDYAKKNINRWFLFTGKRR